MNDFSIYSHMLFGLLMLPMLGFVFNGLLYPVFAGGFDKTNAKIAGSVASLVMFASFVLAVFCVLGVHGSGRDVVSPVYQWLQTATLSVQLNLHLDRLSSLMILVITGVGTLIHVYSIGYMAHEKGAGRFFSYLNLFCFAMLLLVLSDDLIFVFFGWEGVGLCSYLLIGYWHEKKANVDAARKAFLVSRIGDFGFMLGLLILVYVYRSMSLVDIVERLNAENAAVFSLVGGLFFFAATGKSAQFPLYVWLPDAMAGPTPVSALIHAATMVTAGIYLFARLSGMFELLPDLMLMVAWVGVLTSLGAGKIALVQNDIKKVLAYSTISQLGFMFLAVGVGAYNYAVFHLMTHAFFKALLFLGAGSIIHGCGGEQNMEKMGGLRKFFPITFIAMLVGSLALVGLPPFSGFFSKDGILFSSLVMPRGGILLFVCGLLSAYVTGMYTFRMLKMVFFGEKRFAKTPHESPLTMTLPLIVLALLATLGGFLHPHVMEVIEPKSPILSEGVVSCFAVFAGVFGAIVAHFMFRKSFRLPALPLRNFLEQKFFVDEAYDLMIVRPLVGFSKACERFGERFIQAEGPLVATLTTKVSSILRANQNGDLQWYAFNFVVGISIIAGASLWWVNL